MIFEDGTRCGMGGATTDRELEVTFDAAGCLPLRSTLVPHDCGKIVPSSHRTGLFQFWDTFWLRGSLSFIGDRRTHSWQRS